MLRLLTTITLTTVFANLFLFDIRGSRDMPFVFNASTTIQELLPSLWSDNTSNSLGSYVLSTLWQWPLDFVYHIAHLCSLDFNITLRLIGILPIITIGFFSIRSLLKFLKVEGSGKEIGTTLFLINSYILLLIDGGQLSIGLAYALLPLTFKLYLEASQSKGRFFQLRAAGCLALLGIFDLRFLYLFILLFGLRFLFEMFLAGVNKQKVFLSYLQLAIVSFIVMVVLNLYWLLPAFISRPPVLPPNYLQTDQLPYLSLAKLTHALFFQQPHWFENIFGRISSIKLEFAVIPVLVFLAPFLKRKDREVGFWLIVALVGVFLAKGVNPPFGFIYAGLFNYLPGFNVFRDPVKFYFLTSLAYTILIGVSINSIVSLKIKWSAFKRVLNLTPFLTIVYLLFLSRHVIFQQTSGLFAKPNFETAYENLAKTLEADQDYGRILWIPEKPPLGYVSSNHPSLDAVGLTAKRPFALGVSGTYETINYLRKASFTSELADIAGISYLVYTPVDPKTAENYPENIKYYQIFLDQISKLSWLDGQLKHTPIPTFKTKKHQNVFYLPTSTYFVIGSDNLYKEATKSSNLSLRNNALIFLEEQPAQGGNLNNFPGAKILLNDKGLIDLAATFIPADKLLFPSSQLTSNPNHSGWWKRDANNLIWWRDFLQTKYGLDNQDFDYGGGWTVGEGRLALQVKSERIRPKDVLLARVLESSRSGEIEFYQAGEEVGEIKTFAIANNFRWFEVGEIKQAEEILIRTRGEINVINTLALVSKQEWQEYQEIADSLRPRITTYNSTEQVNRAIVNWQKINPTKYKIQISNLKTPSTLVFSASHDTFWELNRQRSVPVYSLLNGFWVEQDGEYTLEYKPQKYVYYGLILTGLGALTIIYLLAKKRL